MIGLPARFVLYTVGLCFLYAPLRSSADPRDEVLEFFGSPVPKEEMAIKSHERIDPTDATSPIVVHPCISSFVPGKDQLHKIPTLAEGDKYIWMAVLDRSPENYLGFKVNIGLETPLGYYKRKGKWQPRAWGHPTLLFPGESALSAGEISFLDGVLTIDNFSGRVMARTDKHAMGLALVASALEEMTKTSPFIERVDYNFRLLAYGGKSNDGANRYVDPDRVKDLIRCARADYEDRRRPVPSLVPPPEIPSPGSKQTWWQRLRSFRPTMPGRRSRSGGGVANKFSVALPFLTWLGLNQLDEESAIAVGTLLGGPNKYEIEVLKGLPEAEREGWITPWQRRLIEHDIYHKGP
jgi:hypothetical protein